MPLAQYAPSRKSLRFTPDPQDFAQIDTDPDREEFYCEHVGLIREEAPLSGCGIVCFEQVGLKEGKIIKLKVGRLEPLRSEVVWGKKVDTGLYVYGIKFLD